MKILLKSREIFEIYSLKNSQDFLGFLFPCAEIIVISLENVLFLLDHNGHSLLQTGLEVPAKILKNNFHYFGLPLL